MRLIFFRHQQSPMNSDEDPTNKKQKLSVSDALAAQLRSKYSSDLPVKRNANTDIRTIVNRSRVMDKSKIIQQKVKFLLAIFNCSNGTQNCSNGTKFSNH